jgi:hypothetical protein
MTDDQSQGSGPANTGGGGVQATLFTQDQVNQFNAAAKRGAVGSFLKDLGLDPNTPQEDLQAALKDAEEYKKLQAGQQSEVQQLTNKLTEATSKADQVPELQAVIERQKIAAKEKLPIEMWEFVRGKTEEEITDSVKTLKGVLGKTEDDGEDNDDQQKQQPRPGTGGRPPEPNPQQGRGGGRPPGKTLSAGADAYRAKHKKE